MGENDEGRSGCGCCGAGPFGLIGTVVAAVLSWQVNHSWGWAIVHGILSWFYVIYHFLKY
jgi:hypothetical protein